MYKTNSIVKICCIQDIEEANTAISYGARAIGLVSKMPCGPGPIPEEKIAEIASSVPPCIASFLLTSETDPVKIIAQQKFCKTNTIQLVDSVELYAIRELKNNLPGIKIVQVIHVNNRDSIGKALEVSTEADAILLDSGNQELKIKELGGTGRVHDWNISREIREKVNCPVFLAGGLTAGNVKEAIKIVRPFGVDICSGVRTNHKLNENKLKRFMKAVK